MFNADAKHVVLFFISGIAGGIITFLLSMSILNLTNTIYGALHLDYAVVMVTLSLIVSCMLIYLMYKLVFKEHRILVPLFFTLIGFYTFVFLLVFTVIINNAAWNDLVIIIFIYLPVAMILTSWLFYLLQIAADRIASRAVRR